MEATELLRLLKLTREAEKDREYKKGEIMVRDMVDDLIPAIERLIQYEQNSPPSHSLYVKWVM